VKDFGPIDKAAEAEAMQTLFFADGEFEGTPYKASGAHYLVFLSMRGEEVSAEVERMRAVLRDYPPALVERDIVRLLKARNWRFHNVACVVMACGFSTEKTLTALWHGVHQGSWASPQLCSTALYIDPNFKEKALALVEDKTTYFKSIVPLATLLHEAFGIRFAFWNKGFWTVREAKKIDRDNSGAIASGWLESLTNAFG